MKVGSVVIDCNDFEMMLAFCLLRCHHPRDVSEATRAGPDLGPHEAVVVGGRSSRAM